ncbi:MAG: hypothetical protein ABI193_22460, partial [Minicystis sp.]
GTPRYMSPEQARGEIAAMGPESDVYTLGAVLYEILSGHPPYLSTSTAADSPERIVVQVRSGPPPSIEERARREIPAELRALTAKAMARARPDRYPDAGALMEAVRDWLDGASRRERALAIVREANHAHLATIERMRAEADRLRARAKEILDRLQTFDKAQAKAEGWKLEDDAAAIEQAALREEIHWTQKLRSALNEAPDLEEAHETLAEHYAHRSQHAEAERDQPAATRFAALLDEHAGKLREERRTHYEARSRGDGRLTFLTEPASARVLLKRYEPVLRYLRLDERSAQQLRSPIRALDLPRGSYLLLVTAPGYRDLRYPVMIGRGEHWDGVRPGSEEPLPIPLLRDDALGPDDIYVPAGPCISGGDPHAGESLSRRKFWIDGFVIQKHPITNADYVSFLNALASRGMHAEARRAHRPKTKRSISRRQKVRRRACRRSRSSSRRLGGTLSRAELREAGAIVPTGQGEVLRSSRACLVVQALLARPVLPLYHCAARAEHRIGVAFAILLPPRSYADRTEHMPTTTRMCRRGLLEGEIECLSSTNQVRQHTIASRAPTHASQSSRLLSFKNRVYPHFRHDSPGAISHLTRSTSGDEIGIALGPASMSRKGITMKITTMFTSVLVLATITAGCGTPELSEEELGVAYQRQLPVDARQNYVTEVTFTTGAYVAFRGVITNNTTVGSYNSDTEYWYTRSQALGSSISMSASANTYTGTQLDSFHSDCTTAYDTTQVVGTSGWTQGTYAAPSGSVLYRATDPDNGSVSIGMLVTQDSGSELKTIVWYKTANTGTVFATTPSSLSWTQVFDGSRQPSTDPADISSSATWYHTSP